MSRIGNKPVLIPEKIEMHLNGNSIIVKGPKGELTTEIVDERIKFENQSIIGSISLKGAAIDDLTFKDYNTELESNEKIILLAPRNIEDGYLIESGFVTSDKNVDIPDAETIWSLDGNDKLTEKSPIKLSWTNDQGLTFVKEFSLDDKYLFTIKQKGH